MCQHEKVQWFRRELDGRLHRYCKICGEGLGAAGSLCKHTNAKWFGEHFNMVRCCLDCGYAYVLTSYTCHHKNLQRFTTKAGRVYLTCSDCRQVVGIEYEDAPERPKLQPTGHSYPG